MMNLIQKDQGPEDKRVEEQEAEDVGSRSDILSSIEDETESVIPFSDIPIMQINQVTEDDEEEIIIHVVDECAYVNDVNGKIHLVPEVSKPDGSAYISIEMSVGCQGNM